MIGCARVLIAEDECLIRETLAEALVDAGFEVAQAGTGDAAAAMFEAEAFSLLLTDINMPGKLDGVGLARRVRERDPGLPVVFVTGRPLELNRAAQIGSPRLLLHKPFRLDDMVSAVRRLLDEGGLLAPRPAPRRGVSRAAATR